MGRTLLLWTAVGVMGSWVWVHAHHAVGDVYDESRTLTLEGEIAALVYRNPHSILHVDVVSEEATRRWAVEWRGATRLRTHGLGPGTLRPGDRIVVCGYPAWDPGQYRLLLLAVHRPSDGWSTESLSCEGGPVR